MQINSLVLLLMVVVIAHAYSVQRGSAPAATGEVVTTSSSKEAPPEPSCEELKQMWRFSKRQSRAAEITNEIPTYRDPFSYNVWEPYAVARSRSIGGMRIGYRGRPVFGRVVHKAPLLRLPDIAERHRAFEEVARMYGAVAKSHQVNSHRPPPQAQTAFRMHGGDRIGHHHGIAPQAGSFQHLKELIKTERARELREQRRAEEAAARNEALKELARNNHRAQLANYNYNYDKYYDVEQQDEPRVDEEEDDNDEEMKASKALLAFPDLLAPPAMQRFGGGDGQQPPSPQQQQSQQFVDDYNYFRDRPRSQRAHYYHPNSYENNMDGYFDGFAL